MILTTRTEGWIECPATEDGVHEALTACARLGVRPERIEVHPYVRERVVRSPSHRWIGTARSLVQNVYTLRGVPLEGARDLDRETARIVVRSDVRRDEIGAAAA